MIGKAIVEGKTMKCYLNKTILRQLADQNVYLDDV